MLKAATQLIRAVDALDFKRYVDSIMGVTSGPQKYLNRKFDRIIFSK